MPNESELIDETQEENKTMNFTHYAKFSDTPRSRWFQVARFGRMLVILHNSQAGYDVISFAPRSAAIQLKRDAR